MVIFPIWAVVGRPNTLWWAGLRAGLALFPEAGLELFPRAEAGLGKVVGRPTTNGTAGPPQMWWAGLPRPK